MNYFNNDYTIPEQVFNNGSLKWSDKCLYALIIHNTNRHVFYELSNNRLSEMMQTSFVTISKRLKRLEQQGYIKRENHGHPYQDNSKNGNYNPILSRYIIPLV